MVIEASKLRPAPHVVAFPFPAPGHIVQFVEFSKVLASNGVTVTFVTTTPHLSSAKQALTDDADFAFSHSIHLVAVEFPTEYATLYGASFLGLRMAASSPTIKESFEELIRSLVNPPTASLVGPPACIISDMFLGWTQVTATKYSIPRYCVFPSTHFLSLCCHLRSFVAHGRIPVTSADQTPFIIPGFPPIKPSDLPSTLRLENPISEFWSVTINSLWEAAGFLVDSVHEMDSSVIEGLPDVIRRGSKTQVPRILTVGPTLLNGIKGNSFNNESQASIDKHECIDWLNTQPSSSVLYISFGSYATLSATQILDLALGLEMSGKSFLWVLRLPQGSEGDSVPLISAFLPQGFMERTKKRGLVFSAWAPQLHILAHPAVGGFLTHCGWNSTVESICMAVPIIGWPMDAEQFLNKTFAVDVLKVAVEVHEGLDGVVGKEEVERAVRLLMEDERGEMLRKNVKDLSVVVRNAVAPGGSSHKNVASFVAELQSLSLQSSLLTAQSGQ